MMAAIQPFVSGGISKTVNMPEEATPEDIMDTYISAWKMGLKSISVYRDQSKRTQPVTVKALGDVIRAHMRPKRRRLPDERRALTHKFSIAGHEGYLTVGMFEDDSPGEIFLVMAKEGSVVSGLMDTVATMTSMALQYGVPLALLVRKFSHVRFEPSGFTDNPEIPIAKSIIDYIFRWLALKFLSEEERADIDAGGTEASPVDPPQGNPHILHVGGESKSSDRETAFRADGPPCPECGSLMIRAGSCYHCRNCGTSTGCS
jgi:ribonucleoside-diphosphate reductase alpha chain